MDHGPLLIRNIDWVKEYFNRHAVQYLDIHLDRIFDTFQLLHDEIEVQQ